MQIHLCNCIPCAVLVTQNAHPCLRHSAFAPQVDLPLDVSRERRSPSQGLRTNNIVLCEPLAKSVSKLRNTPCDA